MFYDQLYQGRITISHLASTKVKSDGRNYKLHKLMASALLYTREVFYYLHIFHVSNAWL